MAFPLMIAPTGLRAGLVQGTCFQHDTINAFGVANQGGSGPHRKPQAPVAESRPGQIAGPDNRRGGVFDFPIVAGQKNVATKFLACDGN